MNQEFEITEATVAGAMLKMGWSFEVAADTLSKALNKFEGSDLYTRLVLMGYLD